MDHYKHSIKPIAELIPYALNARTHTDKQITQIMTSIQEFGFTNPILIDEDGGIIAGHCRVLAVKNLSITEVPCITLTGLTSAQKKAYVIADNQLALNAGWDLDTLKLEIEDLQDLDFDIDLLGFDDDDINNALLNIDDIDDVANVNESVNLKIVCDDLSELAIIQSALNIKSMSISANKLLGMINENSST